MSIFRGPGGAGNATTDSEITLLTQLEQSASQSATSATTSATNAATSASQAATSASNAALSASNASTSAANAESSATAAASSATSAASSATAAGTSATNAANSATAASTSATNAASSATAAAGSASSASTSETNAASSASAAATSASNAATSASNAAASASSASTSATNAATSASTAATSASNAAASATNAVSSATAAAQSAQDAEDAAASIDTSNFVNLSSAQTITGVKTFSNTIVGSVSGNSATATALQTARTIGGVSFNGTANINLPGVNTTGNQDTTGSASSVSGTTTAAVPTAALASGTANSTTFLRGDRTWQAVPSPTIASTAEAQAGTNNTNFITPLRMREGFNASGSAPVYACRAWVNFNGTGTVAIRASGNVSSITDLGTGVYRVNFTTAMPDTNYSVNYNTDPNISVVGNDARAVNISNFTTSSFQLNAYDSSSGVTGEDQEYVACSIFR